MWPFQENFVNQTVLTENRAVGHPHVNTQTNISIFLGYDNYGIRTSTFLIIPCDSRFSKAAVTFYLMWKGIFFVG